MVRKATSAKREIRETDLYAPIRDYLVKQGYTVRGEVLDCDMTATRGDDLVVVELKRSMALGLLLQATQRQKISDTVYVAVPRPKNMGRGSNWRQIKHMLQRLELGLILVAFTAKRARVEVAFHPVPVNRRRNKSLRRAVITEMEGRSGDYNAGGSTGRKLLTAYRESALYIAYCLDRLGPTSPRDLRELDTGDKTQPILYHDVYEWFERVDRGVYGVRKSGRKALKEYAQLKPEFRRRLAEAQAAGDADAA